MFKNTKTIVVNARVNSGFVDADCVYFAERVKTGESEEEAAHRRAKELYANRTYYLINIRVIVEKENEETGKITKLAEYYL